MKATGWAPKHTMAGDIAVEVANYIASDDKKEWSDEDRKVDLEVCLFYVSSLLICCLFDCY